MALLSQLAEPVGCRSVAPRRPAPPCRSPASGHRSGLSDPVQSTKPHGRRSLTTRAASAGCFARFPGRSATGTNREVPPMPITSQAVAQYISDDGPDIYGHTDRDRCMTNVVAGGAI